MDILTKYIKTIEVLFVSDVLSYDIMVFLHQGLPETFGYLAGSFIQTFLHVSKPSHHWAKCLSSLGFPAFILPFLYLSLPFRALALNILHIKYKKYFN